MTLHALATAFLLVSLGQASSDAPGTVHPWEAGPESGSGATGCGFPARLELAYTASGKRQFPKASGKGTVCHHVARDATIQVHGNRGTVAIRESGKRPPRGSKLIACDEKFQVLRVDPPRHYADCPAAETGFEYQASVQADSPALPAGRLSVVFCGAEIAKVVLDVGGKSSPCNLSWQADEPLAEFGACAERMPPAIARRSTSGTQRLPCGN